MVIMYEVVVFLSLLTEGVLGVAFSMLCMVKPMPKRVLIVHFN